MTPPSGEVLRSRARQYADLLLQDIARQPDLATALVMGEWLAHYLSSNLCGVYRLDELEERLVERMGHVTGATAHKTGSRELHIASQLYAHGGHSQLLKKLVTHASATPDVLLTREMALEDVAGILAIDTHRIVQARASHVLDRVREMAGIIACYDRVVLHVHPEDLPCALAIRLAKKISPTLRVGFFNHADHSFSVGIGASDVVFEISTYGWRLREARGTLQTSTFVGIPIDPPKAQHRPQGESVYALSAGAAYKFKPAGEPAFPDVLNALLDKVDAIGLTLIGPDPKAPWWQPIQLAHGKRVTILPNLPRDQYMRQLLGCALYIDSHPLTGGTAFPEALLSGLNVIGLKGGTWGFSFADLLRAPDQDSFITGCQGILAQRADLLARQEAVRQQCRTFHASGAVLERMRDALDGTGDMGIQPPPPELLALGSPPLMGETNWEQAGKSVFLLPTRYQSSFSIHGAIAMRHLQAFGLTDRASWRLFVKSKVRRLQAKIRRLRQG